MSLAPPPAAPPSPVPARRTACVMLAAASGDVRAAKGVVGRAIRAALRVRRWHEAPHHVRYITQAEGEGSAPRFCLDLTDDEAERLLVAADREALAAGFSAAPIDFYHD